MFIYAVRSALFNYWYDSFVEILIVNSSICIYDVYLIVINITGKLLHDSYVKQFQIRFGKNIKLNIFT